MWNYFSENVQQVLIRAQIEAQKTGADFIGSEHLMLGILWNRHNTACRVLKQLEVDLSDLHQKISKKAERKTGKGFSDFPFSARAARIIEIAYTIARNMDKPSVGSEHILLGILREGNGSASKILSGEFRVGLSTVTEQLFGIDQLKLSNVMESRRAVEEGLKLLESQCVSTVMKEKINRSKVDEVLNLLEYSADLLWSMGYESIYQDLLILRNRLNTESTATPFSDEKNECRKKEKLPHSRSRKDEPDKEKTTFTTKTGPENFDTDGISISIKIDQGLIYSILKKALTDRDGREDSGKDMP